MRVNLSEASQYNGTMRKHPILSAVLLAAALAVGSLPVPLSARQEQQGRPEYRAEVIAPQHDAFGFQLGEERRYARGPDRIFRAGEFEVWTIRLDEISRANTGMPLYSFTYGRELSLINSNSRESMDNLRATMSVTVNHYGFPVEVRYGGGPDEESATDFVNKRGRLRWLGSAYLFRAPGGVAENSFIFVLPAHDAVKILVSWLPRDLDLRVLAVDLEIADAEAFLDWLEGQLQPRRARPLRPGS